MLSFWPVERSPPGVNNLFRGIPFYHENKIPEHIKKSLLLGRRTKGNFACYFRSFLQVFERGFLLKISYFDRKERPIKAREITETNMTYRGSNKTVFNIIALIFGSWIFSNAGRFY